MLGKHVRFECSVAGNPGMSRAAEDLADEPELDIDRGMSACYDSLNQNVLFRTILESLSHAAWKNGDSLIPF